MSAVGGIRPALACLLVIGGLSVASCTRFGYFGGNSTGARLTPSGTSGASGSGGGDGGSTGSNQSAARFSRGGGLDASVRAMAQDSSGIYVAGNFGSFNGVDTGRILRLKTDGSLDTSFQYLSVTYGTPSYGGLWPDGKGKLYSAWNYGLLRHNPDGSIDTSFNGGAAVFAGQGPITAAVDSASGKVYVVVPSCTYNGQNVAGLIRLNQDGSVDNGFVVDPTTASGISALATSPDGKLYLSGSFTTYNGASVNNLVRLNADGSRDTGFSAPNTLAGSNPTCLLADPKTGNVFVGRDGAWLVLLHSDGTQDVGFHLPSGAPGIPLRFDGSGRLYVRSSSAVALLNPDGTFVQTFPSASSNTVLNDNVIAAAVDDQGRAYLGGNFSAFGDTPVSFLARFNVDGSFDNYNVSKGLVASGWDAGTSVRAMAVDSATGNLLVAGDFDTYDGSRTGTGAILRLRPDGTRDTSFSVSGHGFSTGYLQRWDGAVNTVAVDSQGRVYAGGPFTSYNGASANRIARLHPDGTLDTSFVTGTGFDGPVYALALDPSSGKLYVGGAFIRYNDQDQKGIARLNPDGSVDTSFSIIAGFNADVMGISLDKDGKLLVAGHFTWYRDNTYVHGIARLNPDGSLDTSFHTGNAFASNESSVNGLFVDPASGKIYVFGSFTSYNDLSAKSIVRLNADGTRDGTFQTQQGAEVGAVNVVLPTSSGGLFVGGSFARFNGAPTAGIVLLRSDGSVDPSFAVSVGIGGGARGSYVGALAISGNSVFVGGGFSRYQGTPVSALAKLDLTGAIQ